jgi:Tol biopolymer transport system component
VNETLARITPALADRYRIERELGAGGMATVFLAHDIRHERHVAIKVLHPELAAVLGAERFLAEIKTTAKLQHSHILPLLDSGEAEGLLFYVMPVVEGEALRARLARETQLPLDDAVRITKEVASALDYAHRHGVIHRDIKPENILLHDGHAVVADFGIALAVSAAGGSRLTQTGLSLGTPQYMSPEQAMGERSIDARSDVYSLGCVLYEMLAGEPPFTGPSAQAIVAKVITTQAAPVSAQRPTVPPHVAEAIRIALQKLPPDRFATAAQFSEALSTPRMTADVPSQSVRRPAPQPAANRVRRFGIGLGLLVAGVAAGAVGARMAGRFTTAPAVIGLRAPIPVAPGDEAAIAISPDGGTIAVLGGTAGRIQVRKLSEIDFTELRGTDHASYIAFSPNGEWIAFRARNKIRKVRTDGGGLPVDIVDATPLGLTWGADDQIIYSRAYNAGLARVSAQGGQSEELTTPDTAQGELGHWHPQVLPDGQHVLFTTFRSRYTKSRLEVLDLRTKKRTIAQEGALSGKYVEAGYLMFVRADKTVFAVAFDPSEGRTRGEAVPVLDDVNVILTDGLSYFVVAPNGTLAYLPHSQWTPRSTIVWVDRVTGKEQPLFSTPDYYADPRLSPDQSRVLFTKTEATRDLWLYDRARGSPTPLTRWENADFDGLWHPDGDRIFYVSERPVFDIYTRRVESGAPEQLLLTTGSDALPTSIHPDGKILAYVHGLAPNRIKLLALDSATRVPDFPHSGHNDTHAMFSPDGKWIAYVSDESSNHEIYVRPFANPGSRRYQITTRGGLEPRWTRGGREIVFRHGNEMFAVGINPATGEPGTPVTLFSGPYAPENTDFPTYDVVADGSRFLMVKLESSAPTRDVVVIVNWVDVLKAKLDK